MIIGEIAVAAFQQIPRVVGCVETRRDAFIGDCLFAGLIGRTDLPGGSDEQLKESKAVNSES